MNYKIKKSIYLMMLSSLLLTGCSKENKIENTNDVISDNQSDDSIDNRNVVGGSSIDIVSEDAIKDERTPILDESESDLENAGEVENEESTDLTNDNSENLEENSEESIDEVEESIYESILPNETFTSEEEVIEYFDKLKNDIEILLSVDDKKVDDKIEARVMLFVDYMVEDIEVGGYQFTDLDIENQMRIKNIYIEVDNMIEETKPDYKEMLIDKSYKFKNFCVDKYHDIKDQVKSWYQDSNLKTSVDNYIEDGKKLYEYYKQENKKGD